MQKSPTVLLVEDNANDRALILHELRTHLPGVVVREAWEPGHIEEALQMGGFDLAITDYDLGWTTGVTLLHRLRSRWPGVPVIVCSGNSKDSIRIEVKEAGGEQFVEKTACGFDELLSVVVEVVQRSFRADGASGRKPGRPR